jgi:FAD/FMN-containing dehydrogenase
MIDVQCIEDIQAAFQFAKDAKTPLVIKNTGHDWKGRSSGPGSLALWTHNLRSPEVPIVLNRSFKPLNCTNYPPETVLHFGPGETWAGAYQFAEDNEVAVLGGTCGTVGIAGWLHGGGHSPLTPVYGMGVDNVRQIEIVTPRGEVKIANECLNTDLFFAVRGGGGGTFGLVINITSKALPRFGVLARA